MIKTGVTTGLYFIARSEELATSLRKVGYALTRGVDSIEISGDSPHEIDYSIGKEMRHLAKKQGMNLCFHGSLTTPVGIPERSDWRDAQDHMEKSARSAVHGGCKYVLFHSCLHFWLEMITYTSSKLEIVMCDHIGRFVSEVLYENKRLREWFLRKMWDFENPYPQMILDEDFYQEAAGRARIESDMWATDERAKRIRPVEEKLRRGEITKKEADKMVEKIQEDVSTEGGIWFSKWLRKHITMHTRKKMAKLEYSKRKWKMDQRGKLTDGYTIMGHYMFYNKDPLWKAMAEVYKDVLKPYKMDYNDDDWLDKAWTKAQERNDRKFKEFYYAAISAKFLEGHLRKLLEFVEGELEEEMKKYPDSDELVRHAKNLKITIENPDARDPKYAGLYLLWHPKQIYAAVKTIRKTLKTDRIFMTIDWEHIAGQGVDPIVEIKKLEKTAPDFGKYVISVHSNSPNPLHAHYPLELGDTETYTLNYFLRKTGFGTQNHDVWLWFERGGGDDPFRQAVDTLKLMAKFLQKDVPPDKLPEEYFGLKLTGMDFWRQEQVMRDHRFEPLKDLMEVPEEEWGLLSSSATRKGKTKEFKKAELR